MQALEIVAILSGIISVWFSRKENIWVYPSGLIGTILYVYLSIEGDLYGEATVNLFYTIMSVYGWYNWLRKDIALQPVVHISYSNTKDWITQVIFFLAVYTIIYTSLYLIKQYFNPGAIPWADALASAAAFTGHVAHDKEKSGELDLVDHHQYCFHPIVFCKRVYLHGRLLCHLIGDGSCRTHHLEKKGK